MKYKGAVFFDYDGTLADEKKGIFLPTQTTQKALAELSKNGYMTVLATGRAMCYVPETGIAFDGYVTTNGAYAEVDGKMIHEKFIDTAHLERLMQAMDEMGLAYSLERQHACYGNNLQDPDFLYMLDNFNIPRSVFYPLTEMPDRRASKLLMAYRTEEQVETLVKEFEGVFGLYKHRKNQSLDINQIGITKATGAAEILRVFEIPKERAYAFGDASNDYDMLKLVGHGVAMREHVECLDEVCEMVADGVENEGIAKALREYELIK